MLTGPVWRLCAGWARRAVRRASMCAMTEPDTTHHDLLLARVLVVVATVAVFLVLSMSWYVQVDSGDGQFSGWDVLGQLTGDKKGGYVFAGWFGLVVAIGALLAGAGVVQLRQRWVCVLLSVLLPLLAVGMALVHLRYDDDLRGEQLAAAWAGVVVLLFAAVAWGNLAGPLRQLSYEKA